jgi:hypothetical protein
MKPLPPTDDKESPPPTPSKLPQYFWKKVAESQKASSSSNISTTVTRRIPPGTPTPVKQERRIPSSGTSVTLEPSTIKPDPDSKTNVKPDPHEDSASSGCESEGKPDDGDQSIEEPLQIAHLKPQFSEFTHSFPSFPKTHKNGYAYIIELSDEILNEKALLDLRDALQYSLTGGGGARVLDNVKFFAGEGENVPMKIHYRVCAGTSSPKYLYLKLTL